MKRNLVPWIPCVYRIQFFWIFLFRFLRSWKLVCISMLEHTFEHTFQSLFLWRSRQLVWTSNDDKPDSTNTLYIEFNFSYFSEKFHFHSLHFWWRKNPVTWIPYIYIYIILYIYSIIQYIYSIYSIQFFFSFLRRRHKLVFTSMHEYTCT